MTADFIPQILIIVGLVGGLAILVKRSQSLSDEELLTSKNFNNLVKTLWQEKVVARFPKEDLERRLAIFFEKLIRRSRIVLTKIDSLLAGLLDKVQTARKRKPLDAEYWTGLQQSSSDQIPLNNMRQHLDPLAKEVKLQRHNLSTDHTEYLNIARLYLAQNNFPDARRILITAWRLKPEERTIWLLLDDIRLNEGKKPSELK